MRGDRERVGALMVVIATVLAACGSTAPSQEPTEPDASATPEQVRADLTIAATEFAFEMPEELPSGEVVVEFENIGGQPHFFDVALVEDGTTSKEVEESLTAKEAPEWILGAGPGFGILTGGQSALATASFSPGTYLFTCFLPDAEGTPHAFNGMYELVTVGDGVGEATAAAPDVEVAVSEGGWTLPDLAGIGGEVTFRLTGEEGSQDHSFEVGRILDDSISEPKQVDAAFEEWAGSGYASAAPFDLIGGIFSVDPGEPRSITMTFTPGTYLFHDAGNPKSDRFVTIG